MEWPARSPDLNPIEHLWVYLGREVAALNPPPRSLHELKQGLLCVWSSLPIPVALAKRKEIDPFLKRMVTEDEKWVTYDNIVRSLSCSKLGEAAQTVLLPYDQTLNSNIYCQQLDHLKLANDQQLLELTNRRSVVFHQNNFTPHTFGVTSEKRWELGWEVLMHPLYTSNLALNGYHLFLALQSYRIYKKLGSREDCENRLLEIFTTKGKISMREAI
ncbi:putative DD34D transposase [Trichonephila clavipes]|nr:putative DD34D transposase [Trichonephila clavipes]